MTKTGGLPPFTFISAEAVFWAKSYIENVLTEGNAIQLFQSMVQSGHLCHASGDRRQPFKHGFYLYCIIDSNTANILFKQESDIKMFEKEWMEVEIVPQNSLSKNFEEWYEECEFFNGNPTETQGIYC